MVASSTIRVDRTVLADYCRNLSADLGLPVAVQWLDEVPRVESGVAVICVENSAVDELFTARFELTDRPLNVACVELCAARGQPVSDHRVLRLRGRGLDGIRWAARALIAQAAVPMITEGYGPLESHVGDLRIPESKGSHPVIVIVHGGGWRECWERDYMAGVAVDLTLRGYATWNIEYRRVGPSGGGWPRTPADVAIGVDAVADLAERYPLDRNRVAVLGHSAGGQLAAWAASRSGLPTGAVGADPVVVPTAAFLISGALDFEEVAVRGIGDGAASEFMGGMPQDLPDAYAMASPLARLPLVPCRQLVAYGTSERIDLIDGNSRYCARARELGKNVDQIVLRGADHFSVVDPRTLGWESIARAIDRIFPTTTC